MRIQKLILLLLLTGMLWAQRPNRYVWHYHADTGDTVLHYWKIDQVFKGPYTTGGFGQAIAGNGDTNGDGIDDIFISSYMAPVNKVQAGRAWTYNGSPFLDNKPDVHTDGLGRGYWHGESIGIAGDVNNDGTADLLVGS